MIARMHAGFREPHIPRIRPAATVLRGRSDLLSGTTDLPQHR